MQHTRIYTDHSARVALLKLDTEEDINWDELSWNVWSAEKLRKRWADLKAKAKVNTGTSHRGEYISYCVCYIAHDIFKMSSSSCQDSSPTSTRIYHRHIDDAYSV
jgi:hypothetical protein